MRGHVLFQHGRELFAHLGKYAKRLPDKEGEK
jgi:hypothetical protein